MELTKSKKNVKKMIFWKATTFIKDKNNNFDFKHFYA